MTRRPSLAGKSLVAARSQAIGMVAFVGVLLLAGDANAYVGEQALRFAADYIIAPVGLISLVVALVTAFFRPDLVKSAVYVLIICVVIYFVIAQGNSLLNAIRAG